MLAKQASFFSDAIPLKEKGISLLQDFKLTQAQTCFEKARAIDPYLADVDNYLEACEFLKQGSQSHTRSVNKLAELLHQAYQRYCQNNLNPAVFSICEKTLCQHLLRLLPHDHSDFVGKKQYRLHTGYLHLVLEDYPTAHKKLLNYLTCPEDPFNARLWGYLGDSAYAMRWWDEANRAYLRALFVDALSVDLLTLKHPDIQKLYQRLRKTADDSLAKLLLPIACWFEKILEIPPRNTMLLQYIKKLRRLQGSELPLHAEQRYKQFALCLYIDQSGLQEEINFEARLEMQWLDRNLFEKYLSVLGPPLKIPAVFQFSI